VHASRVPAPDEFWIPLVDEPIGRIVDGVQREHPEIAALVESPDRLLAFRTFAYIRVGILLGRLLVDSDIDEPSERWVEQLLEDPAHRARVEQEVRAVAEEIDADPRYGGGEPIGPDDETRARFREFARRSLGPA
jgi:hypothetical protein